MSVEQSPEFRTSSFCQDGGCVEVGWASPAEVLVRDKKNPHSPVIPVGAAAWRVFLHSLRQVRHD